MMKQLKRKIKMCVFSTKAVLRNANILTDGQTISAGILQLSHRLEKGLAIRSPRRLWGWDKAKDLAVLISRGDPEKDRFAIETGKGVLGAYIAAKEATGDSEELEFVSQLKALMSEKNVSAEQNGAGGTLMLSAENILLSKEERACVEKLFATRHSVRDYSEESVSREELLQAIELANRCPSACNRQSTRVYVLTAAEREELGYKNSYNADKYLIITGCISSFKANEMNDWIVSASIFAGYLTLTLHMLGIGSCVIRKELVRKTEYNEKIRRFCNIAENEQIVLELAVGKYKDSFKVPMSNRISAEEIVICD